MFTSTQTGFYRNGRKRRWDTTRVSRGPTDHVQEGIRAQTWVQETGQRSGAASGQAAVKFVPSGGVHSGSLHPCSQKDTERDFPGSPVAESLCRDQQRVRSPAREPAPTRRSEEPLCATTEPNNQATKGTGPRNQNHTKREVSHKDMEGAGHRRRGLRSGVGVRARPWGREVHLQGHGAGILHLSQDWPEKSVFGIVRSDRSYPLWVP